MQHPLTYIQQRELLGGVVVETKIAQAHKLMDKRLQWINIQHQVSHGYIRVRPPGPCLHAPALRYEVLDKYSASQATLLVHRTASELQRSSAEVIAVVLSRSAFQLSQTCAKTPMRNCLVLLPATAIMS